MSLIIRWLTFWHGRGYLDLASGYVERVSGLYSPFSSFKLSVIFFCHKESEEEEGDGEKARGGGTITSGRGSHLGNNRDELTDGILASP